MRTPPPPPPTYLQCMQISVKVLNLMLHACRYLLRLCLLESREGVRHDQVSDERIRMAFSQSAADTPSSRKYAASMSFERGKGSLGPASRGLPGRSTTAFSRRLSRASLADDSDATNSVARDLGRMDLGFGSPVQSGP